MHKNILCIECQRINDRIVEQRTTNEETGTKIQLLLFIVPLFTKSIRLIWADHSEIFQADWSNSVPYVHWIGYMLQFLSFSALNDLFQLFSIKCEESIVRSYVTTQWSIKQQSIKNNKCQKVKSDCFQFQFPILNVLKGRNERGSETF